MLKKQETLKQTNSLKNHDCTGYKKGAEKSTEIKWQKKKMDNWKEGQKTSNLKPKTATGSSKQTNVPNITPKHSMPNDYWVG